MDSKVLDLTAASSTAPDIEIFFAPLIVVNNGFTKTPGLSGLTVVSLHFVSQAGQCSCTCPGLHRHQSHQ
jgi:hypothetical protein